MGEDEGGDPLSGLFDLPLGEAQEADGIVVQPLRVALPEGLAIDLEVVGQELLHPLPPRPRPAAPGRIAEDDIGREVAERRRRREAVAEEEERERGLGGGRISVEREDAAQGGRPAGVDVREELDAQGVGEEMRREQLARLAALVPAGLQGQPPGRPQEGMAPAAGSRRRTRGSASPELQPKRDWSRRWTERTR
jgi:hypothetical protein